MNFLSIFLIILIIIGCLNAQDTKTRPSPVSNFNHGRTSPVFFHRKRLMAASYDDQPGFGYRLRMPSSADPKTYLNYNRNNNDNNNQQQNRNDNDLMDVRPRPIIINRSDNDERQTHNTIDSSVEPSSTPSVVPPSSPSSSSSFSESIQPSEYPRHFEDRIGDQRPQQQQQQPNQEPSVFTGSNNFYSVPQPSSSANASQFDSTSNPINDPVTNIPYYGDKIDNNQQQFQQHTQFQNESITPTNDLVNNENSDKKQVEWLEYMQRFRPTPSDSIDSGPAPQQSPATPVSAGTPLVFNSHISQPSQIPSDVNRFVQIPRPGGPLQPQYSNVLVNQFRPIEIPQQRFPVIQTTVPQQQQQPAQTPLVIIPQPTLRYIHIPLTNQANVASPINQIRYLQPIPPMNYMMTIPPMKIVTPVIRFGSNNGLNAANIPPVNRPNVLNYKFTREPPVYTQTRVHTPVFVTNVKPSQGFKYTIQRADQQPLAQQQPTQLNSGPMIPVAIPQHRVNTNINEQFYKVPIPNAPTRSGTVRNFVVPPYMNPIPIETVMQQPSSFYSSNNSPIPGFQRVAPGETHTLPVVSNQPSQGGGDVTITIEPIPSLNFRTGNSANQPAPEQSAPAQSSESSQSSTDSVADNNNNNNNNDANVGQPLRQAVFEPIESLGYPSDYPDSDSRDEQLHSHSYQEQNEPTNEYVGHPLRQPDESQGYGHGQQHGPSEQEIGQPLGHADESHGYGHEQQYGEPEQDVGQTFRQPDEPHGYGHGQQYGASEQDVGQPLSHTDNFLPIYGPPSVQNNNPHFFSQSNANTNNNEEISESESGQANGIGRGHRLNYEQSYNSPQQPSNNNGWTEQQKLFNDNQQDYYQQQQQQRLNIDNQQDYYQHESDQQQQQRFNNDDQQDYHQQQRLNIDNQQDYYRQEQEKEQQQSIDQSSK